MKSKIAALLFVGVAGVGLAAAPVNAAPYSAATGTQTERSSPVEQANWGGWRGGRGYYFAPRRHHHYRHHHYRRYW